MKKIIAMMTVALLMTACSSKLMTLKEGVSKETTVTFSSLPSSEELVTVDEETTVSEELAGDKYIITAVKGEKTEMLELPVTFETVDIDGTLPVDLSQFYSNPDKLAKISYVLNEDETVMTVTDENSEEPHSFDVPVNVIYPSYTIEGNITIDTYTGYDINDFVTADEGVEIASTLDEENSTLNITLSKNNWTETFNKEVTIIDTNPFPLYYVGHDDVDESIIMYLTLNEDGTGFVKTNRFSGTEIIWQMEDSTHGFYKWVNYGQSVFPMTFSEDKKTLTVRTSTRRFNGNYGYFYLTLQQ